MIYNDLRPVILDNMRGQETVVESIRNQAIQGKFFHVYILSGQFGGGKTTVARMLRQIVNCEHRDANGNPCMKCASCRAILSGKAPDIVEIDGASNNGVDNIRELIASAQYLPVSLKYKVYIIDEVHMLSDGAFNALLKTLEEPPEHCIFILCTTEFNKIPITVRSRAAKYRFLRIQPGVIVSYLKSVADKYEVKISDEALKLIAKLSNGAMRDALTLFEQAMSASKEITEDIIKSVFGVEDSEVIFSLLNSFAINDTANVVQKVNYFYENGKDMSLLIDDILAIVTDSILYKSTSDENIISGTASYINSVVSFCSLLTIEKLFLFNNDLFDLRNALRNDGSKSIILVSFLRLMNEVGLYDDLVKKVGTLERVIENFTMHQGTPDYEKGKDLTDSPTEVHDEITNIELEQTNSIEFISMGEKCENPFSTIATSECDPVSDLTIEGEPTAGVLTSEHVDEPKKDAQTMQLNDDFDFFNGLFDLGPSDEKLIITSGDVLPLPDLIVSETNSDFTGSEEKSSFTNEDEIPVEDYPEQDQKAIEGEADAGSGINCPACCDNSKEDYASYDQDDFQALSECEGNMEVVYQPSDNALAELDKVMHYPVAAGAIEGSKKRTINGDIVFGALLKPHYDVLLKHLEVIHAEHLYVDLIS